MAAAAAAALALALGSAGGASGETSHDSATRSIRVGDNFFSPRRLTVARRTKLRFVWVGRNRHNVSGRGRTSRTTSRRGFVHTRTATRTTTYVCTIHADEMRVRVRVR